MTVLYPWHHALWEHIRVCRTTKRLPHALLFTGPEGLGKRAFAAAVVQSLSCERPQEDGRGCGLCDSCRLQQAGTHPDNRVILPLEGKQAITITQIRQVQSHLALKTRQSRYKTVTIFPAEEMTLNAANSLLKALEEPPGEALVILVASVPSRIPLTLRSRCQRLEFLSPQPREIQSWLQERLPSARDVDFSILLALTGGAPLRVLAYVEQDLLSERRGFIKDLILLAEGRLEALDMAPKWFKKDLREPLHWMAAVVGDIIRIKSRVGERYLLNRDVADLLYPITRMTDIETLFTLHEKVSRDRWLLQGPTRVNSQLLLEGLLIYWTLCFGGASHASS